MKIASITRSILLMTTLSMTYAGHAHALTDEEALEQGMIPLEQHMVSKMNSILTAGLNAEGVARAVQTHRLVIAINKANVGPDAQTLVMYENGVEILKEKISTGREREEKAVSGKVYVSTTPKGYYRPTKMYTDYLSYTWNAPMPNAVFIVGGIAIHATGASYYPMLGSRASGGCIRTKQEVSKFIREKIMETGLGANSSQYKIVNEGKGRNRVTNNSVQVDKISRSTGDIINGQELSWDTVVVVYE